MARFQVAAQVYSVRVEAEKDFKAAVEKLKAMGYDGVELAGLYGYSPEEIRDALRATDLPAISAHVPYNELIEDMDGVVGKYAVIGCSYIAIPYLTEEYRPGTEKFDSVIENIKKIGKICKDHNITLLYHNHEFEFEKMQDGSYGLDYLYDHVSPDLLQTEIDTCWVNVSGLNPSDYVRKYKGRSPIVHLKDFVGSKSNSMYELIGLEEKKEEAGKAFSFRAVGTGVQDMPSILAAAEEAGAKWVVVEQDAHDINSPMEDMKISVDYLRSLGV